MTQETTATAVDQRMGARVRRLLVPIAAQGISSISNLTVGLVVARSLGPEALGQFSLLFTIMLVLVAVQTAWVGDSLTVLDREDVGIRRALATAHWAMAAASAGVGWVACTIVGTDAMTAFAFALLCASWLCEEFGRRTYMARQEFHKQALNDFVYLVVATAGIGIVLTTHSTGLAGIFVAMTAGALAAYLVAQIELPRNDRLLPPLLPTRRHRAVSDIGFWRASQSAVGYATQVTTRSMVVGTAGAGVMGTLELARLITSPIFTVIAAISNATLARFARPSNLAASVDESVKVSAVVAGATLAFAVPCLYFNDAIVQLFAGDAFRTDRIATAGWLVGALALIASLPSSCRILALGYSRPLFYWRLWGLLASIPLTGMALAIDPSYVPLATSGGLVVTAVFTVVRGRLLSGDRDAMARP